METRTYRHFYRCQDCLTIAVVETSSYNPETFNCDCGGTRFNHMGYAGRDNRLRQTEHLCPCDARCTNAVGPHCDCQCGGENHGSKMVVEVQTYVGDVPTIKPRADIEVRRAMVAEFKQATADARDRLRLAAGENYERKIAGLYIPYEAYWLITDTQKAILKAQEYQTHKRRMSALAAILADVVAVPASAPVAPEPIAEPVANCPIGKSEITGTVVSTKWQSSDYGDTLKMLVKSDDGFKVFGTVPEGLKNAVGINDFCDRVRGARISLTATIERKQDDPSFGFFKRPTVKLLELAIA